MHRFLVISDLHLGKTRESTTHPGIIRQANSQAAAELEKLLPHFNSLQLDAVFHLGDAIRDTFKKDIDTQNLITAYRLLEEINAPQIHVLGNHDLLAFTKEELSKIFWRDEQRQFSGVKRFDQLQVIWLDMELTADKQALGDVNSLRQNLSQLDPYLPTIILSHYAVIPIDATGSYYYASNPADMHLQNYQEVLSLLAPIEKKIFINAHVHLLTHKTIQGANFISNPAFTENIAAENHSDNHPAIYSIIEFEQNRVVFSSYSSKMVFGKVEVEL